MLVLGTSTHTGVLTSTFLPCKLVSIVLGCMLQPCSVNAPPSCFATTMSASVSGAFSSRGRLLVKPSRHDEPWLTTGPSIGHDSSGGNASRKRSGRGLARASSRSAQLAGAPDYDISPALAAGLVAADTLHASPAYYDNQHDAGHRQTRALSAGNTRMGGNGRNLPSWGQKARRTPGSSEASPTGVEDEWQSLRRPASATERESPALSSGGNPEGQTTRTRTIKKPKHRS